MPNYYNEIEEKAKAIEYLNMGDLEFRQSDPKAIKLKEEIILGAIPIINGVIFYHRFQLYEPVDDLVSESIIAFTGALERFDPDYIIKSTGKKVKLFNFFSLTAKNCCKYYTMKNSKHRYNNELYEARHIATPEAYDKEDISYVDDFIRSVTSRLGNITKYKKIIPILEDYLKMSGGDFKKREFYKFAHKYNITTSRVRKFLIALKIEKEDIKKDLL